MSDHQSFYTKEEISILRKQIALANAQAMAEVIKSGAKIHPRVAALKAALKAKL